MANTNKETAKVDKSIAAEVRFQVQFINKHEAARILGVSPDTLKTYRRKGILQKEVHWNYRNSKTTRYNRALLEDLAANYNDPVAHHRAIENFQKSLLSNQPQKPGRKSKAPASVA